MKIKICIPVKEKNIEKLISQIKKAEKYADFIEVWLDSVEENIINRLIKTTKKPVIAVCKRPSEHGAFYGREEKRILRLEKAIKAGARFLDISIKTKPFFIKKLCETCKKYRTKLIISEHFWVKTPGLDYLLNRVKMAYGLGTDIVKIAANVTNWTDNTVLFELTRRTYETGKKIIVIGMGEKGRISRIGCPLLGSFLTYAALDERSRTAPGQWTVKEFRS